MYAYEQIRSIHLEVSALCQARCPMCPRTSILKNSSFLKNQIYLNQFKNWFPVEFISQLESVAMCGNIGDPILAQDTLSIFHYLNESNPSIMLKMNTNGSAKSSDWWRDLAKENVHVVFGIDGLEDTHHLYRVDTNWKRIIKNASTFTSAGGSAQWDMLVFKHNEHQINECEQLSKSLGFKVFNPVYTDRFNGKAEYPVLDRNNNITHYIHPATQNNTISFNRGGTVSNQCISNGSITCSAKIQKSIYVSANGNVSPCCWLGTEWRDDKDDLKLDYIEKRFTFNNLHHMSLKDIFNSNYFNRLERSWKMPGLCPKICKLVCEDRS